MMRYAIISDIHSNLEALQSVVEDCQQQGVESFLCGGDIVGYGASPRECIDLIKELGAVCVAGNHDWAVSGKISPEYFSDAGREVIFWTWDHLLKEHLDFLYNLELIFQNKDLVLVHGTLQRPAYFYYLTDIKQVLQTFDIMENNVCFVAHTHVPQIFIQTRENIFFSHDFEIDLNFDDRYIINTGSVGQPRDGSPLASYCIYDTNLRTIKIKRIPYNVEAAQRKISEAGLPQILAQRLDSGE